ncbi:MAG: hypothetical protein ACJAT3_002156 [Akkermansiaceae bacterium]|jgi:hypothetical protein
MDLLPDGAYSMAPHMDCDRDRWRGFRDLEKAVIRRFFEKKVCRAYPARAPPINPRNSALKHPCQKAIFSPQAPTF